jgi:hypothetical protein
MGLQYGASDVLNLTFKDFVTKKPFAYADYAKATDNSVEGTRTFITGGQGGFRLLAFDSEKVSTVTVTLPLVDLKLLAMIAGDELVKGAANVFRREEGLVTGGKVSLKDTPIDGSITVFLLEGIRDHGSELVKAASAPTANQFSVSGKDLTFNSSENGKKVVIYYQFATPVTAQKFSIKANKFPKFVEISGNGLFKNQETGLDEANYTTYFKAQAQPNMTLTLSQGSPTELQIVFDLFAIRDTVGDYIYSETVVV